MRQFDHALFYAINRSSDSLSGGFYFLSEFTDWTWGRLVLLGVFLAMLFVRRTRLTAILILVAFPLANEATDILKAGLKVPRPCVELPDVILRVPMMTSFGTASAHSANMAAVATIFWLTLGWRWGLPWAILAFLTGVSRIYVGVHYPTQIFFGFCVGATVAVLVWRVAMWIKSRRAGSVTDQNNTVEG